MSEITDDILEGTVCDLCCCYLGEGFGYPRRCTDCGGDTDPWEPEPPEAPA